MQLAKLEVSFFGACATKNESPGSDAPNASVLSFHLALFASAASSRPPNGWTWVRAGAIESFTVTTEQFQGLPEPPYAIAYVTLDGATTAMVNFVEGVPLTDLDEAAKSLAIGTRVRVEWKSEREGRITDFYYVLD